MKTNVGEKGIFLKRNFLERTYENTLYLAMLEKSDMIWKSYMFNLKKGTLKFLLNSCLDTLQHKLTFYNGEHLYQISVNYVYGQTLNCKLEDKKLQTKF